VVEEAVPGPRERISWFAGMAFLLIAAVMTGLAWHLVRSYRISSDIHSEQLRLVRLIGEIRHLDEVLTMSARMAAVTGAPEWEQRYMTFEPQLSAAIKEARQVARAFGDEPDATATDEANTRLVAMETQAFESVRAGRLEKARQELFSPAYEAQKAVYAHGMEQVTSALEARRAQLLVVERGRLRSSLMALVVAFALLVVAGWLAMRALRAGEVRLLRSHQELQSMNQGLDQKVNERTAALSTLNVQLQQEVSSRKHTEQELARKVEQLETLNKLLMGREERILEMKQEVNVLLQELGRAERYHLGPPRSG